MTIHQYAMIATMALVVILLRSIPFLFFGGKRKVPPLLLYLGSVLTAAAIAMLVVYSLYGNLDCSHEGYSRLLPALAAGALTVILHCFLKNPLISIIAGTALFMILI